MSWDPPHLNGALVQLKYDCIVGKEKLGRMKPKIVFIGYEPMEEREETGSEQENQLRLDPLLHKRQSNT